MEHVNILIEKLASSPNPLIQGLGLELQGLNTNEKQPVGLGQQVGPDQDFSIDNELAQGTETDTKPKDEIDAVLSNQMPELSVPDAVQDNQSRVVKAKVATYRELLLQRKK